MGKNDRFVVKRDKGCAVEKPKGKRASRSVIRAA